MHYDEQDARLQPAIERVHRFPDYLNNVKRICESGGGRIDPDTYLTAESYEVAREAVQTWLDGADEAMENGSAFVVARPPGHHATPASGMGFCLLSNAAIAARYLQDTREISRIGIVDFDVHHGNGTEAAVKNVEGIRFASSHQWPFYPGTGMPGVIGKFNGVKNFVLSEGDDIEAYREVFEQMLEFVAEDEGPEAVIVSAGFDAMRSDHVAGLCLETKDYKWMAGKMRERFGSIPVLFGLEGGYDVSEDGVGEAVKQCIRGWLFEADEE